jgi:von Willebrand factor type A domain
LSSVELASPLGALAGLAALPALVALARMHRRGNEARRSIGLPQLPARKTAVWASIVIVLGALVGLAAAQPFVVSREPRSARQDVAAWVVIDTSRSMLAARAPGAQTRMERARRAALAVRRQLPDVPVGVASISDRVLPHLFPSLDARAFGLTVTRVLAVGVPAPEGGGPTASSLSALVSLAQENYFLPWQRRRAAVVITDAGSDPFDVGTMRQILRGELPVTIEVVRIGSPTERVFDSRGQPESGYQPDLGAAAMALRVAAMGDGQVFAEGDAAAAGRATAAVLGGEGPVNTGERIDVRRALAPFVLALAALPLLALLLSRNLPRSSRRSRPRLGSPG